MRASQGHLLTGLLLLSLLVPAAAPGATAIDWQNPADPLDVNDDGQVTILDMLLVQDELNAHGSHVLDSGTPPPYYDVDGDGRVTPADALALGSHLGAAGAEVAGGGSGLPGEGSAAGVGAVGGTTLPGAAQPFTFEVPVVVERLHTDVQAIGVECYVARVALDQAADAPMTGTTAIGAIESIVGAGISPPIPVPTGAYAGTVSVGFGAFPWSNAAQAIHYACGLVLYGAEGRISDLERPYTPVTDPEHPHYDAWQPAPATDFVVAVSGPL